ncbi:hypothetical protein [Nitrosomonas sp.]|uniref:hypothetical protein n=1 Tax=Nitrosomonas sp. TaxID=42353 RepID=UPI002634703A|nr:hypothetical protein [Nitrosomonas sp.]
MSHFFICPPVTAAVAVALSAFAVQQTQAQTTLGEVVVKTSKIRDAVTPEEIGSAEIAAQHAITRDTASLLRDVPGFMAWPMIACVSQ